MIKMTSIEFISTLLTEEKNSRERYDCFLQVLKDLKVLKILKEYLTPHIIEELCIEEKEVKEWLDGKD